jgi:signal transduction histidine kinase/ligand-binding sensor domain-containing protein
LLAALPGRALDPERPLATQAQRTWRSDDGLRQETVTALAEATNGFLWIGTEGGLVRFDGATFEPFSRVNVPGFLHNEIQALAEDPGGALWIGTTEPGLYRLQHGAVVVYGAAEGLPEQPIRRLLRDTRGTLWAAPEEGPLLRFDGSVFRPVPSEGVQLRIRALCEAPDGTLWVGTVGSGLWRIQKDHLILAALTAAEITALAAGREDQLLVGTRTQGLLRLEEGRLEAPPWARELAPRSINALLWDRQGSLWIGLDQGGLCRRNPGGRLEAAQPLAARWTPLALLEDRAGALWVGSDGRGLSVLHPVPFQTLPLVNADPEEPIRMVCQDRGGTVWCLTGDQALGEVRQGRIHRFTAAGQPGEPITALWPRAAGGVWLGTRRGELFSLDQGRFQRMRGLEGGRPDAILSLFEDPHHVLWLTTAHQGLLRLAPGTAPLWFPTFQSVLALAGGGEGPLFLGSATLGLGVLEGGQARWLGRREGLRASGVQSLLLDDEGTLWVGTPEGLRRYREGSFQDLGERPGPLVLSIHGIQEDARHHLWLSTVEGVFRIPRAALVGALDPARPLPAVVFDQHDGLPSREARAGAHPKGWLTREGELLFATQRGLARMAPNATLPAGPRLQLHFLKTEGDETILPESRPVMVPAGTHRFEVYYTAISLTRAEKVRFRYRLEGLEHTWNEVGDRRFSAYSNLPPGAYRFVLQAWHLGEEGPPEEAALAVQVQPFLHQRPAFWMLCVLAAGAFGWWLLRLRLQQVEARSAVLDERNRMAREIHDHLAQGFTGVMLQLEAAEARLARMEGDPEPVLTRLDHARNLAATSLQEARRSVLALRPHRPEGADLLGALRILADRLLAGTDIQVELAQTGVPRHLAPRLEEELLRMAQEALTNALRHGKAKWVRVVIQFEARDVRLSIEDDGQGFDPAADAAGYGMRSIRDSLGKLRGRMEVDSGPGLGTRILITIPTRRWRP